jgi:hypothetical protein
MRVRTLLALSLSLAAAACADGVTGDQAARTATSRHVDIYLDCTASRTALTTTCTERAPGSNGSARFGIYGQNQVKLRSFNVHYDSQSYIYQADIDVQNLLAGKMGTNDGVTITGIKAFHNTGPSITSYVAGADTGTVYVFNPDGYDSFTAPDQPYFEYSEILPQYAITSTKLWQWFISSTVQNFAFTIKVSADLYTGP